MEWLAIGILAALALWFAFDRSEKHRAFVRLKADADFMRDRLAEAEKCLARNGLGIARVTNTVLKRFEADETRLDAIERHLDMQDAPTETNIDTSGVIDHEITFIDEQEEDAV